MRSIMDWAKILYDLKDAKNGMWIVATYDNGPQFHLSICEGSSQLRVTAFRILMYGEYVGVSLYPVNSILEKPIYSIVDAHDDIRAHFGLFNNNVVHLMSWRKKK